MPSHQDDASASPAAQQPGSAIDDFEVLGDDPDDFSDLIGGSPSAPPAPPAKAPRFTPMGLLQFMLRPRGEWIVKGVLPRAGLAVVYGASGSGKTFLMVDLAGAVARGIEWRGNAVVQGRVVYVVAEGASGFRNRVEAYCRQHDLDPAQVDLLVIPDVPNLLDKAHMKELIAAIKKVGPVAMIVIDTYARVMAGANENDAKDTGQAVAHCDLLHRVFKALVVLIHHSGKDATKGARGWSGLRAAADAEIEVVREGDARALRLTKSKDGEDGLVWGFALEVVQIGVDEDIEPITSCVVVDAPAPAVGGVSSRKLGSVETIVNAVIQEFALAQTEGIEVTPVVLEAVKRMDPPADGKRDTRKMRVRKALESLCNGDDAPYWLGDDGCIAIC